LQFAAGNLCAMAHVGETVTLMIAGKARAVVAHADEGVLARRIHARLHAHPISVSVL